MLICNYSIYYLSSFPEILRAANAPCGKPWETIVFRVFLYFIFPFLFGHLKYL